MPSIRTALSLAGLIAGLVWWAVDPSAATFVTTRGALVALFVSAALGLSAAFTYDGQSPLRWCGLNLGLAAIVAGVTSFVGGQIPVGEVPFEGDTTRIVWWGLGCFAFLYVCVPFAQIRHSSGRARFPYPELFRHSWNNFFIGVVGALFVGLAWLVLDLWSGLFEVIGISFFDDLFSSTPFEFLATGTLFGFGLAVGRENEAVIRTLRRVTLTVGHVVLPCLALIALLFTLTLPFTGLAPLWETGDATPLCLSLLALLALFLNAVYEEGETPPRYPRWLLVALRVAVISMPVFAAIALRGTSLRIEQYGLTPDRVFALLFTSIAALYALGYAVAAAWPGPWLRFLQPINVTTALVIAGVAILVQLPVLDPMRLSAESQVARLLEQRVAVSNFDFALLRFELGHRGQEAFERMLEANDHPAHDEIAAGIERAIAAQSRWSLDRPTITASHFSVSPSETEIPAGLIEALGTHSRQCATGTPCLILAADLDRDQSPEYCLFVRHAGWARCYKDDTGRFERIGNLQFSATADQPSLRRLMESRPLEPRPSRYDDLVTGDGDILVFVPRT